MVLVEELEQIEEEEDVYLLEIETEDGGDNLMPLKKGSSRENCISINYKELLASGKKKNVAQAAALNFCNSKWGGIPKKDSKKEAIVIQTNIQNLDGLQKEIDKEIDRLWDLSSVLSSIKRVVEYFSKSGVKG